ncbi:fimbrillin family protein [Bacteroides heparinolyticus]|uniref:fimbrillin family protein n=1 Tax=Prevotella heparinolytica TaxID=28113 RepID=UPI0035A0C7ED
MKNQLLFAALAVTALLSGCSKEEESDEKNGRTPISFVIGGVETRAVTTYASGSYTTVFEAGDKVGIYATGGAAYSNTELTVAESGGSYTLGGATLSYTSGTATDFTAYYPYKSESAGTVSMTVGDQSAGIKAYDLMTATKQITTGSTVSLQFQHQMAMVQVQIVGSIGTTATAITLKNVLPTVTWTAAGNSLSAATGSATDIPMYRIDAASNTYVALIPAQTLANGTEMFRTQVGGKTYTFKPNSQVELTKNKVSKFKVTINASGATMESVSNIGVDIAGWTVDATVYEDFTASTEEVPAVELISTSDFTSATLGTRVGGLKDIMSEGWAQVGPEANAAITLAGGTLTMQAPTSVSSAWYNRTIVFRSKAIASGITKFTLKFTVKCSDASGNLQLAVMQPESSNNTWFQLNTVLTPNYIPVSTTEITKELPIDLSISQPIGGVYTDGILLYFTPKTNDGYTYTITNVTLVEKK